MKFHAKKSLVLIATLLIVAGVVGFLMITNYPDEGVYLVDVAPYYSTYLIILILGIVFNRLVICGVMRLVHFKEWENKPWQKDEQDLLAEHQGIYNVFLISLIGLVIALSLMYFKQELPLFFIALFLVILAAELTLLGSTFYYHREQEFED